MGRRPTVLYGFGSDTYFNQSSSTNFHTITCKYFPYLKVLGAYQNNTNKEGGEDIFGLESMRTELFRNSTLKTKHRMRHCYYFCIVLWLFHGSHSNSTLHKK